MGHFRSWKEEGLTQPIKKGRKRAKGGAVPLQATHANHVWTYDFVHDRTEDGQPLRFLTVEDEYTREGLIVAVGRSMPAVRVIEVLKVLFRERGTPEYLRSDNVLTTESTFLGEANAFPASLGREAFAFSTSGTTVVFHRWHDSRLTIVTQDPLSCGPHCTQNRLGSQWKVRALSTRSLRPLRPG